MRNDEDFTHDERESIQIMVRSAGWKTLMRQIITPYLQQTNARLDAMGTPENQTQVYRGAKMTIKHIVEAVYKIGQMPDPFTQHQEAFLIMLDIPTAEHVVDPAVAAQEPKFVPKKRSLFPVL